MSWLELVSPTLSTALNTWADCRSGKKVPSSDKFESLVNSVSRDFLVTVSVPPNRNCKFTHVGSGMAELYPGVKQGMTFNDIVPITNRLLVSRPIHEILVSRQAASRRSTYRITDQDTFYEQLYLPFVDKNFNVCLIAIVGDGYMIKKGAA